jgi:chaperonin GroES
MVKCPADPSGTTGKTIRTGAQGSRITGVPSAIVSADTRTEAGLPIRMLHDRVLVRQDGAEGERRSVSGIVIPATASVGRRLSWATAVGIGPNVRSIVVGDRVLFDPEERSEVELHGREYVLLRERDVHAVAASRVEPDGTGLYL